MANIEIRTRAMNRGIKMWQIADALGVADSNLSRRLRKELSTEEQKRILSVIDQLAESNRKEGACE